MNCSDFERRMQHLIDENTSLEADEALGAHAQWCNECRHRMALWQRIEAVLVKDQTIPNVKPRAHRENHVATWSLIATVAAVLLLAFFVTLPSEERVVTKADTGPLEIEDQHAVVDPASWWRTVQDQDWIGQTMPAVNSVRDGVAPLGRSLLQAVAILTTARGESTS